MVYLIIEFSRVIFTEPRVFVRSRFQKCADQPNGGSGLPLRSLRSLLAMTSVYPVPFLTALVIARA